MENRSSCRGCPPASLQSFIFPDLFSRKLSYFFCYVINFGKVIAKFWSSQAHFSDFLITFKIIVQSFQKLVPIQFFIIIYQFLDRGQTVKNISVPYCRNFRAWIVFCSASHNIFGILYALFIAQRSQEVWPLLLEY